MIVEIVESHSQIYKYQSFGLVYRAEYRLTTLVLYGFYCMGKIKVNTWFKVDSRQR